MSDVIRVAAVAVTAAICAVVVKRQTPEIGIALVLVAGSVVLSFALTSMGQVTAFLDSLADTAGLSPAVLSPVLKVTGIAVIAKTSAELCRDAKESGLASFVETAASALALVVTIPLLKSVLTMITGLI